MEPSKVMKPSSHRLGVAAFAVACLIAIATLWSAGVDTRKSPFDMDQDRSANRVLDHGDMPEQVNAILSPAARKAGADESWWQAVSVDLERQEYAPSPIADGGLQAPNRAHNLRTTFGKRGIEVLPKTENDVIPAWRFTWETTGFGRPGRIEEISPSTPSAAGARVVYQRKGWSEWYENTPKGLEQGFIIEQRPEGEGPLQITGTFPASLWPKKGEDGAVDFLNEHGTCAIRYGELHVWDAEKQELPAKLVLAAGNTLAIEIDDRDAAYPILVDPLMTSPAWINESNQANAGFGISVATAGDVNGDGFSDVIVGAYFFDNGQADEGRAYVYHAGPGGLSLTPAWINESNQPDGRFGNVVAPAGDVNGDGFGDVIVGAPTFTNGQTGEGRAYVYHGSVTGLSLAPAWINESNQAGALFGTSTATAGDVNGDGFSDVIVGALQFDNGQADEGRAFVYHGSVTGLSLAPAWINESNQAGALFGSSVAMAGDVNGDGFSDVIVGAHGVDNGQIDEGRAFVYHGSPGGLSLSPAWNAESQQAEAYFGIAVSTAGDVNGDGFADAIVGAYFFSNGQTREGRAFVYHGSAGGLTANAVWTAESDQSFAYFGNSVATAGDVNGDGFSDVLVGAPEFDSGQSNEGRAFVYQGSASGLSVTPVWIEDSDHTDAYFGASAATAGDVNGDGFSDVIIGARGVDNGQTDEGRAFVYHGAAAGLAVSPTWTVESNQVGAHFGGSVATAGDVNGDGYSDIIVYAQAYDNNQADEGRVYVFHGSPSGPGPNPAWTAESNQEGANDLHLLSTAVATAGDVNGDGFSDVIVGFPRYDNGQVNEGRVVVYYGSQTGLEAAPAWIVESDQADARFGFSVATAGDVNGDGFSDVIVGAWEYDNGEDDEGRAYVFHGSPEGLATTPGWMAEGNQIDAIFGLVVATAGDLNADGFSDVIVGAPGYDDEDEDEGAAFVYLGSATGLSATTSPAWTIEGDQLGALAGHSTATAGDVDGDGFSDVVIGAIGSQVGNPGSALIYRGSLAGLVFFDMVSGGPESFFFGQSVGTAGDVNGDGFADIIVGEDHGAGGRALAYYGSPVGFFAPSWIVMTAGCCGQVATAGDVNGDGFSDVIVGDPVYSNVENTEGRALVYNGNGGDGLDHIARQARSDDSAPIDLLGNSDSESAFRLKALGRTSAGRGNVRLQFEVEPFGTPFDGLGLVTGSFSNTGAPGSFGSAVPLSELASGLAPETLYHWRLRIVTDSPYAPHSRWLWFPYNAVTEADVRTGESSTGIAESADSPARSVHLGPSAPNPFASGTEFVYTLPHGGHYRLAIYDVQGRQVALLSKGRASASQHIGRWDGRNARGDALPSGVYFLKLDSGGQTEMQKLVIAR